MIREELMDSKNMQNLPMLLPVNSQSSQKNTLETFDKKAEPIEEIRMVNQFTDFYFRSFTCVTVL